LLYEPCSFCLYPLLVFVPPQAPFLRKKTQTNRWFNQYTQSLTDSQTYQLLKQFPKGGDLHHHLSGSAYGKWWYELATNQALNGGYQYFTKINHSELTRRRLRLRQLQITANYFTIYMIVRHFFLHLPRHFSIYLQALSVSLPRLLLLHQHWALLNTRLILSVWPCL